MFLYLSFLRPPPVQASLHGTISITPQISDDLRTEPFDGEQDVYYSWTLVRSKSELQPKTATKPRKLTTWRSSSAYKEIPVPIPLDVREGQKWRLALSCQAQSYGVDNPTYINLMEASVGSIPFPVMSVPVLFSSKMSTGGSKWDKQEMIERSYLLPCLSAAAGRYGEQEKDVAILKVAESTSYDLDKVVNNFNLPSWSISDHP